MDPVQFQALLEQLRAGDDAEFDLADLTPEQLSQLETELISTATELRSNIGTSENPTGDLETITANATMARDIRAELLARSERAAELAAEADAALDGLVDSDEETDEETTEAADDEEGEPENTDEESDDDDGDDEGVTAGGSEPARRPRLRNLQRREREDDVKDGQRPAALVASAGVYGLNAGHEFGSRIELAETMGRMMERVRGRKANTKKVDQDGRRVDYFPVASLEIDRPHKLTRDPDHNASTLETMRHEVASGKDPVVASGGVCAPQETVYTFFGVESDAGLITLPTGSAERGQIQYPDSPSIQDVFSNAEWDAALNYDWTIANDEDPSDPATKPCYHVECGAYDSFEIAARPLCLEFGNFQSRFNPELVARVNALSLTAHAHLANAAIINKIETSAKTISKFVGDGGGGAFVEYVRAVSFYAMLYRDTFRMDPMDPLELIQPHWVQNVLKQDIAARNGDGALANAAQLLDRFHAENNLRVQGVYDWQSLTNSPNAIPTVADFLLFAPGTVVRLDEGRLDIGVVRDSTLVGTNDYQVFLETFDGIAVPGHEIYLLENVPTCPTGATGEQVSINGCISGS